MFVWVTCSGVVVGSADFEPPFGLAHAQLEIQAWNDAKSTLRTFIRRFPTSAHINEAKGKLAEASLYH